jgi:putative FmdB family regulatory protein
MPLYEYECRKCGRRFEEIQKFSDEPLKEHPGCGGEVKRLLSAPAFQFKGTGWYVTDYARSGSSGDSAKAKADSEAKADAKADAKPGEKSESKKSEPKAGSPESTKSTAETTKNTKN